MDMCIILSTMDVCYDEDVHTTSLIHQDQFVHYEDLYKTVSSVSSGELQQVLKYNPDGVNSLSRRKRGYDVQQKY